MKKTTVKTKKTKADFLIKSDNEINYFQIHQFLTLERKYKYGELTDWFLKVIYLKKTTVSWNK